MVDSHDNIPYHFELFIFRVLNWYSLQRLLCFIRNPHVDLCCFLYSESSLISISIRILSNELRQAPELLRCASIGGFEPLEKLNHVVTTVDDRHRRFDEVHIFTIDVSDAHCQGANFRQTHLHSRNVLNLVHLLILCGDSEDVFSVASRGSIEDILKTLLVISGVVAQCDGELSIEGSAGRRIDLEFVYDWSRTGLEQYLLGRWGSVLYICVCNKCLKLVCCAIFEGTWLYNQYGAAC